jgi:hypothetical protein
MMRMTAEEFLNLYLPELGNISNHRNYNKFLNKKKNSILEFHINYFLQRLNFINNNINSQHCPILDCSCGFVTTAIFLGLNGHEVFGNKMHC